MNADDRRRARAITKAQRKRRQDKPVNRAIELLIASSEPTPFPGLTNMRVAPGETVLSGDVIYASVEYPGYASTRQHSPSFELGVAVAVFSNAVTVRLHHRG